MAVGAAVALRAVWRWERTRVVVTDEKVFLVFVSSYYGRVTVEEGAIRLLCDILMVADYEREALR